MIVFEKRFFPVLGWCCLHGICRCWPTNHRKLVIWTFWHTCPPSPPIEWMGGILAAQVFISFRSASDRQSKLQWKFHYSKEIQSKYVAHVFFRFFFEICSTHLSLQRPRCVVLFCQIKLCAAIKKKQTPNRID